MGHAKEEEVGPERSRRSLPASIMRLDEHATGATAGTSARWSVERFRTLVLAQPRERLPWRLGPRRKLEPDVRRALVDAPAIGESRDEEQAAASDVLRTSRADLVLEPAALVDHLAANDVLVELKSEDDLAASVL